MFHVPNQHRIRGGTELASPDSYGNNGAFMLPYQRTMDRKPHRLLCIVGDGAGWEHVSVSLKAPRCPRWDEMCFVKDTFWDSEDSVIQIHPPASEYVNVHPFTLHLWRKAGTDDFFETPPTWMIG